MLTWPQKDIRSIMAVGASWGVCFRDIICFPCKCIFHSKPAGFGGKSRNTRGTTDGSRSFTEDNSDNLSWYVHDAKHNSEAHLPFHIRRRQGGFLQGYDTSFTVIRVDFLQWIFIIKPPCINRSIPPLKRRSMPCWRSILCSTIHRGASAGSRAEKTILI